MKKRLSVVLSAISVSACALMAPVSVQGMRGGTLHTDNFSDIVSSTWKHNTGFNLKISFQEVVDDIIRQREADSDIGKIFHEAALNSDFEKIDEIISSARSQGINITEKIMRFYKNNPHVSTFLHKCEKPELVRLALENGLEELIDRPNDNEMTPLMSVLNATVAQLLIDNGANVNYMNGLKVTPLFTAKTGAIAQLLIDNGADVNHVDLLGASPIFTANTGEIAQILIDNGAEVHRVNCLKQTPLFTAKTEEIAQLLIEHGADVNHVDCTEQTPLFTAKTEEIAQLLIDHGVDVNHVDQRGKTAKFYRVIYSIYGI